MNIFRITTPINFYDLLKENTKKYISNKNGIVQRRINIQTVAKSLICIIMDHASVDTKIWSTKMADLDIQSVSNSYITAHALYNWMTIDPTNQNTESYCIRCPQELVGRIYVSVIQYYTYQCAKPARLFSRYVLLWYL